MPEGRRSYTATLLNDGTVLIAGGLRANGTSVAVAILFDPDSRTWSDAGRMGTGRNAHTATLLEDGTVLVAGGSSDLGYEASAEVYHPSTKSWTPAGSMADPRIEATATLLRDGTVLVVGGFGRSVILSSAEVYDPRTDQWAATAPLLRVDLVTAPSCLRTARCWCQGATPTAPAYPRSRSCTTPMVNPER